MEGMGNALASHQTAANCLFTILILEQTARTAQRLRFNDMGCADPIGI
jgi:hypothetical protein